MSRDARDHSVKSVELPSRLRLPYVEQGDPSGVPVVFLHAIGDSWHSFELVLAHLPSSVRAFAPTQRGHGDASRPAAGYSVGDLMDLAGFMDAIQLQSAVIVGGSSGGFAARRFAIENPERTSALVLLGSPARLRDNPSAQRFWDSTLSKLADPVGIGFARELAASTLARPVPPAFFETLVQENLKVPAFVWKATFAGLMEDDAFEELHTIRAPALIIWGDKDALLPRGDQEALAAAIPCAQLVVYPGAGHVVYWEMPDRVASDLVAFIRSLGIYSRSNEVH